MTFFRFLLLGFNVFILISCTQPVPTATLPPSAEPTPVPTREIGILLETRTAPTSAPIQQVTPTALPTATPTPTPTTIVYNIVEGDTIWSIAYKNGTDPDTLLGLNPAIRPDLLKVNDPIILPPRPTPLAQAVAGTTVPLAVQVLSLQIYHSPTGGAWLLGEVENQGLVAAENIQLEIVMRDDSGASLGRLHTWLATPLILAGERAPFGLLLTDFSAEPAAITASISAGNSVSNLAERTLALQVIDSEIEIQGQQIKLSGSISNSTLISTNVAIITTLYDQVGNVSGFTQTLLEQPIMGGDSAEFSLLTTAPGAPVVTYRLNVYSVGKR